MIAFGPVPSRRLGRSLGINNIPPKHCSYSCLYCQVGPTRASEIQPRFFYQPEDVFKEVSAQVAKLKDRGEQIDYLTFVPDGEPTLDAGLGETIELLRSLHISIAVISNGSLIWHKKVREILNLADWVSLKVDSVEESVWQRINRPFESLTLDRILTGMLDFAEHFQGTLVTETMLLEDINCSDQCAFELAGFLQKLAPAKAYLSIPTRPTADRTVHAPDEQTLNRFYQIVTQKISVVELLTGYEGNAFASSGDLVADLLAITAVHPMRREAVLALVNKTGNDWSIVAELIEQGKLKQIEYNGNSFFILAYRL